MEEDCVAAAAAQLDECQTRAAEDSGSKLQEINGDAMASDAAAAAAAEKDSGAVPSEGVPSTIEDSLERLLQRQRSELFFELRRLQYGDRPVTGQEQRRRTVENLVLRAVGGQSDPTATGRRELNTADRFSTSADPTEVHRPEEILVEVNALVERRPVSSILQSQAFRRSLENSVRGALQSIRSGIASNPPIPRRVVATATNDSSASSEIGAVAASSHGSTDRERSPSSLSLHSINDLTAASMAAASSVERIIPTPPPVPVQMLDDVAGTSRAGEWIQQHVPLHVNPVDGHQMRVRDLMDQMHHEDFIVEISDLIHRQLVTSSLNGNFRNVLERSLRRHMDDSGIDGARVQEQLRQLPRSTVHMRNDFLDLGIMAPMQGAAADAAGGDGMAGAEQLDNMSVISATAAVALPRAYTQSNAAMSREIVSLKTELQELKNMMRLSFDLQLDIQRSIKQEVSAALAQRPGGDGVSGLRERTATGARAAESDGQCLICLERPIDTALYQCGHLCLCNMCALQLRQNGAHCPVCRAPIRDIMRTYRP